MNNDKQYPTRVEQFHKVEVTIIEVEGKDYLSGEDVGRCLEMPQPGDSVRRIHKRHREELEPHVCRVKMTRNSAGNPNMVFYTETGANLIGMFSRTAKSKDFRLWLARLPRRVRALVNGQAVRQAFELGLESGLRLLEDLPPEIMNLEDLGQLIALRRLGFTQTEAANSLGVSRDRVKCAEKLLKGRGLEFAPVRQGPRRKRFRALAARALCDVREIPSPSPSKDHRLEASKDHRLEACATGGL